MGGVHAPAPIDSRIEKCMHKFMSKFTRQSW